MKHKSFPSFRFAETIFVSFGNGWIFDSSPFLLVVVDTNRCNLLRRQHSFNRHCALTETGPSSQGLEMTKDFISRYEEAFRVLSVHANYNHVRHLF